MIRITDKRINENILEGSISLMRDYPFYFHLLLSVNFVENNKMPMKSMGVQVKKSGLTIFYDSEFVKCQNLKQMRFLLIHELDHFLLEHTNRVKFRDAIISNIVQDMIINSLIIEKMKVIEIPNVPVKDDDLNNKKDDKTFKIYTVPKEYTDERFFEKLYEWIMNKTDKKSQDYYKNDKGLSKETNEMLESIENYGDVKKQIYKLVDNHFKDEVSEEERKTMVDNLVNAIKNRGSLSSEMEYILGELRKTKQNYIRQIAKYLSGIMGTTKKSTWTKPNRKELPLKGFKKYKNIVNAMLDVSGSMSGEFEFVLGFLFKNNVEINLIQCDTEIKKVDIIKNKNQLKKVKIKGLGGTTLQPGIELIKKEYNKYPTLILTDGYCDKLDFSGYLKKCLILTTSQKVEIINANNVKQIFLDKEIKKNI